MPTRPSGGVRNSDGLERLGSGKVVMSFAGFPITNGVMFISWILGPSGLWNATPCAMTVVPCGIDAMRTTVGTSGMLGLRHSCPDAGLEVKSRRLAIRIFDVRIGDRLQIPQPKHVDVGLKQTAIWYRAQDLFKPQRFLGEVEFQEAILIRRSPLKRSPDDIKASSRPGSFQTFKEPERIIGSVDRRKPQRSFDRGKRRKSKLGFKLHLPSPFAGCSQD